MGQIISAASSKGLHLSFGRVNSRRADVPLPSNLFKYYLYKENATINHIASFIYIRGIFEGFDRVCLDGLLGASCLVTVFLIKLS